MKTLTYAETDDFYKELDQAIRAATPTREPIIITFQSQKLAPNSKLFLRLCVVNAFQLAIEFHKLTAEDANANASTTHPRALLHGGGGKMPVPLSDISSGPYFSANHRGWTVQVKNNPITDMPEIVLELPDYSKPVVKKPTSSFRASSTDWSEKYE